MHWLSKVIDFGLAKSVVMTLTDDKQTRVGFSGTPDFASPEQLRAGPGLSTPVRTFIPWARPFGICSVGGRPFGASRLERFAMNGFRWSN